MALNVQQKFVTNVTKKCIFAKYLVIYLSGGGHIKLETLMQS